MRLNLKLVLQFNDSLHTLRPCPRAMHELWLAAATNAPSLISTALPAEAASAPIMLYTPLPAPAAAAAAVTMMLHSAVLALSWSHTCAGRLPCAELWKQNFANSMQHHCQTTQHCMHAHHRKHKLQHAAGQMIRRCVARLAPLAQASQL